jgi:putative membrane protein
MSHGHHGDLAWPTALLACAAAVALYLAAAYGGRRRWPAGRAASWVAGAALAAAAFAPPLAAHAGHDLRAHMAQHLLLGMLAPLGLALGMPVTLALRALPAPLARRAIALLHSRPLRALGHPITAAALNVGGMYLLYLTPLYALALRSGPLHLAVHAHFLLAGYLFTWAIMGAEPAARPAPWRLRLLVLFLAGGVHAVLPKLMLAWGLPAGVAAGAAERLAAAQLMYYGGDLATVVIAIWLFAQWYRGAAWRPKPAAARSAAP